MRVRGKTLASTSVWQNDKAHIRQNILQIILPVIMENILSMLAALIASSMLGHLDDFGMSSVTAVSAQGISTQVTNIVWHLFKGVSIGGTIMIAQARGREDEIRMQNLSRTVMKSLVLFSIPAALVLSIFGENILKAFYNPDPEVLKMGTQYLRITVMGFPALAVMLSTTGIYQGRGDTRTPMFFTLFFNVVNIMIAAPLILGLPFGPRIGSTGAAIALIVAEYATATFALIVMFRPGGILNLEMINRDVINPIFSLKGGRQIWGKGLPSSFETMFWQISSIIMGSVFMSFGKTAYTANQLGLQAEGLADMPAIGFGIASTTLVGSLIGARQFVLGKEYTKEIRNMAIAVMTVGTLVLIIFPEQLMGLLTSNQEVIDLGSKYVRIMGFIQIPQNLQKIYTGALKGVGKTIWPMIIAGIGIWLIRVPFSLIIYNFTSWPVWTIWFVVAADQVSRFVISLIVYKKLDIWNPKHYEEEELEKLAEQAS